MSEEDLDLDILAPVQAGEYDSDAIHHLEPREHVRMRPGMYIGRQGNGEHNDDGIYVLLKEVVDNSVDEFLMGQGRRISVQVAEDGTVTARDYGRGIPLDKVKDCVSQINTGGKFVKDGQGVFSSSIGMNGVGLKAVNFLSQEFTATSFRGGKFTRATFSEGLFISEESGTTEEADGTMITFRPSQDIFPGYHFEKKFLHRRMQHYAWLNAGLSLECNGEKFYSRRGLLDLLENKLENESLYEIIHYKAPTLQFAFCHTNSSAENYYSFANTQYTNDGGTHLSAFKEGVVKGINELAPKDKLFDADDVRAGITGAVAIRVENPVFESQTKNKLSNPEIRAGIVNEVKAAIVDYLYKHPDVKDKIFEKIAKNESVRKEIQNIRKNSKELAARSALKIEKLKDCKFHLCDLASRRKEDEKMKCLESMLFITEGDSAAGSIAASRDAESQAVFAIRGKCENCYGKSRQAIYDNKELYGIMRATGIEESLDNLRYSKIIIATDADTDGFHIRNLLITFFLTFFPQLISSGHLFILETPLFRARSKKHPAIYCYSEAEKDAAMKKIGKDVEVTRFKGLGEINHEEFRQFITPNEIKLLPVTVEHPRELDSLLRFLMGDNTPERKEYIMKNLV
ncbi:MAG: type IIA DNA topoisomerase subunit B [Victivallales bacterium]|nr:type IIA DNA topoisomerase subunit B [Victivallales bacterium]